jgi:hypothetical protein
MDRRGYAAARLAYRPAAGRDCAVLVPLAPYALAPATFRFTAVAALAGRAPLGGRREVALAAYLVARLAHAALPERGLSSIVRQERVVHARSWLSTIALPALVRPSLTVLVDASSGAPAEVSKALKTVIAVIAEFLDASSVGELTRLATELDTH